MQRSVAATMTRAGPASSIRRAPGFCMERSSGSHCVEILLYLLIGFFIVLIFKGFRVVQQSEVLVLERLGSYSRTIGGGLNVIIPFLDRPREMFWISDSGVRKAGRIDM